MYPLKLQPVVKDYLWGGNRLKTDFSIESESKIIAEAWTLSCNRAGESVILNGPLAGKTLSEALFSNADHALGQNNLISTYFPLLIKLIDAKEPLSVQVHPEDGYALAVEGEFGKTEMWYVLAAEPEAFLYYGFNRPVSREEVSRRVQDGSLTEVLNRVSVKAGDVFFIEAGVIHAIGAGILIAEVQQNSNTTYRVFDYERKDASGRTRELHVEKALDVLKYDFVPGEVPLPTYYPVTGGERADLAGCRYFQVSSLQVNGTMNLPGDGRSFLSLLVLSGSLELSYKSVSRETVAIGKGESVFVPANCEELRLTGEGEALLSWR